MKKPIGVAAAAASLCMLIIGVIAVNNAGAALNAYTASLAGTNEVPSQANGYTGSASVTIDTVSFEVCINATTNIPGTDPINLSHIHEGAAGVNGPVVVNFNGSLNTCVTSDATTVGNIVANPAGFYVNIHTADFPSGAVRGQLVLVPPSTTAGTGTTVPSTSTSTSTSTTSSTIAANAVVAVPRFTG